MSSNPTRRMNMSSHVWAETLQRADPLSKETYQMSKSNLNWNWCNQ
jgi:hypothetical protein